MGVNPHFAAAIGRNLRHWQAELTTGRDAETQRLLPQQSEMVLAAQFGVALPATQADVIALIERSVNLIERTRSEQLWLPILERLHAAPEIQADECAYHTVIHRLAHFLRLSERLDEAIALLEAHRPSSPSPLLTGKMNLQLSSCYQHRGRLEDALNAAQTAHEQFVAVGDEKWQASAANDIGLILTELERFEEAATWFEAAKRFELAHGDDTRIVRVWTNIGRLYELQNEPVAAMRAYFEAQEYLDGSESIEDVIRVLVNLGHVYLTLKRHDDARRMLERAQEKLRLAPHLILLRANTLVNLGTAQYWLAAYDDALVKMAQAFEIFEQLGRLRSAAHARMNIGDIQRARGERTASADAYRAAIALVEEEATPAARRLREQASEKLSQLPD